MKKKHEVFLKKFWEKVDEITKEKRLSDEEIAKLLAEDSTKITPDEEEEAKRMGNRIRLLREQKELSVEQLALLADLPVETVKRIELGDANCRLTELYDIAEALGMALHLLFNEEE